LKLFEVYGDRGSYTTYSLIVIAPNLETAVEIAKAARPDMTISGGLEIDWPLNKVGMAHEMYTGE
jgi:hypothetical protein